MMVLMRSIRLAALMTAQLAAPALAQASPLEGLLHAFARRDDEKAMQALGGILWQGLRYPTDSEKDNSSTYVLPGELRLKGFGQVDPRINGGSVRSTRLVNEGDATFEVRFSSSDNPALRGPNQIFLTKPHPSRDYTALLRPQFSQAQLVLLADHCTRDALGRPAAEERAAYYRLDFPGAPSAVFLRASMRDGGKTGPGETSLVFSLFTPGKDMANSGCTLHKSTP